MGIMLVYDITNEKSFDNIKNWIRNIEEHASADVEKMILGNKCDMNDRRQVNIWLEVRWYSHAIDKGLGNSIVSLNENAKFIFRYQKSVAKS